MLFMVPGDQQRLRNCLTRRSLLDEFLALAGTYPRTEWFQRNARAFVAVCDTYGRTAAQHHNQLVARFIEGPASRSTESHMEGLTASGPPLPVLLRSLEALRDLRLAADRDDIASRHADLRRLKELLGLA